MTKPFSPGDQVAVLNHTLSGKNIVEGYATILSRAPDHLLLGPNLYTVRFDGENEGVTRVVHRGYQDDPHGYVASLNDSDTCPGTRGNHSWVIADEDNGGDGRSYCEYCGADGDA